VTLGATRCRSLLKADILPENSPLTRKLSAFVALSDVDVETLARFHRRRRTFLSGH